MVLHSFAKLNLFLEVLNKRKDNYHNIRTVFERINLSDKITLKARPDKIIRIKCNNASVPLDSSNLCYFSAKLLQEGFNKKSGLDITIEKNIPVGAGLGGGSSNAASLLLGLNKMWKLGLSRKELVPFAQKIGADVAFFLYDCAFAQGLGRGDEIKPLDLQRVKPIWHILVVPKIKVLTPLIYRKWDALKNLTKPKYDVKLLTLALSGKSPVFLGKILFNHLERVTVSLYPEVKRIKQRLTELGLQSILMSGSGPAVFGVVSSRKEAVLLVSKLKDQERNWQVFCVRTI